MPWGRTHSGDQIVAVQETNPAWLLRFSRHQPGRNATPSPAECQCGELGPETWDHCAGD